MFTTVCNVLSVLKATQRMNVVRQSRLRSGVMPWQWRFELVAERNGAACRGGPRAHLPVLCCNESRLYNGLGRQAHHQQSPNSVEEARESPKNRKHKFYQSLVC